MRSVFSVAAVTLCLCLIGVSTGAASLPKRLTQAQWSAYLKAHGAFATQTPKSVARFRYCVSKTVGLAASATSKCIGNTAELELTATQTLSKQLHRFERKTAGACSSSLTGYQDMLFGWQSVITGVNRSVHGIGNAATVVGQARNAQLVYPEVTKRTAAFTAACKPRG
jgi:hypothetical protein